MKILFAVRAAIVLFILHIKLQFVRANYRSVFRLAFILFSLFIFSLSKAFSQTTITSAQTGSWTSTSTWVGGVVPSTAAHDNVIITAGHTVTYSSGNTLTTQYGNVTVNGTFIDNGTFHCNSFSGSGNTYNTISGTSYIQTGYGNADFTYSGVIGPGAISLVKNGTGTWTLSGNNSFSSNVTIGSQGFLVAAHQNALGQGAGITTISTYGTLLLSGGITINENINVNGNGSSSGNLGAIRSMSGSNTITGEINATGSTKFTADAGAQLIISTPLSASSTGALTLFSTDAASYISINASFERNYTLTLDGAGDGIFLGKIGTTASVIKNGAGTWTLSGDNNYTGNTTINQGTLKAGIINNAFGNGSAISLVNNTSNASAVLDLNNYNQSVGSLYCNTMGTISLGSATLTFGTNNVDQSSLTALITGTGNIVKVGNGIATLSSANTYTGTTTISAGTINVTTSSLANQDGAFGKSNNDIILGDFNTTVNNASPAIYIKGNNLSVSRNIVISNNTTIGSYTIGSLGTSGTNTYSGSITYNKSFTVSGGTAVAGGSSGLVFSGSIINSNVTSKTITAISGLAANIITISGSINEGAGVTSIVTQNPGQLILSSANIYTGSTTIQNGTLLVQHSDALGSALGGTTVNSSTSLHIQGGITIASEPITIIGTGVSSGGAIRNISGTNFINGPIIISGSIGRINADAGTLTIGATGSISGTDADLYFGGAATVNGINCNAPINLGNGNLIKDGAGICQLASILTLTGTVTINAGSLKAGTALSIPGKIIINSGKFDCSTYLSTAYQLTLGVALQNAGVYGGSSSAASTINNTYFQSSSSGTLTIAHGNCNAGSITGNQTICSGATASTLTSATAGTGASGAVISYKWQQSITSASSGFTDITGAISLAYDPGIVNSDTWYRRTVVSTVSADVCIENSGVVKVSTVSIPNEGSIGSDQTIFYNEIPATITSTTNGTGLPVINYSWEKQTNGSWVTIAGATASTFSPSNILETTFFRRFVIGTGSGINCTSPASNLVEITIKYAQYSGGDGRGDDANISPEVGEISGNQQICYNSSTQISSTISASSIKNAIISYKWEKAESPYIGWTNLSGEIGASLNTGDLTQSTKFRRITVATSGITIVESVPTSPVTISVYPDFTLGSITSNQTICYNTIPSALIGVAPAGSTGTYTYQWEKFNSNSSQWEIIVGETNLNLSFTYPLTITTKYRQKQLSGSACGIGYTNEITITVLSSFSAGSILSSGESICIGLDPGIISNQLLANGGDNSISYQWQSKLLGGVYVDIIGATNAYFDPPAGLNSTTIFRRLAKDGACSSFTPSVGEWIVTVYPQLPASVHIVSSANNNTICQGEMVTFTATPTNGGNAPIYQWKLNGNNVGANSSTYSSMDISNNDIISVEMISNAAPCLVGSPATSNSIQLTVHVITNITSQPNSADICFGSVSPILSVTVNASAPITYQWYENTSLSNTGGTAISGAINSSFTIPASVTILPGIKYYYVKVSGACQQVNSSAVYIRTYPALNIALNNNGPITICNNTSAVLSVTANGSTGVYSYQWYLSSTNNLSGGVPIAGATLANYTVPATLLAGDRYYYVKVNSSPCSELTSSIVKIVTTNSLIVTSHPTSVTICNNTSTTLNGNASGGFSSFTYQWYKNNTNSNIGGELLLGETSSNYTVSPTTDPGDRYYYLVISDATDPLCGTVVTNVGRITNRSAISFVIQPVIFQRICNNNNASLSISVSGSTGNYAYQWYVNSVNSNLGGITITNATSSSYNTVPKYAIDTSFYYLKATDITCNESVFSSISKIITLDTLSVGIQPISSVSICNNTSTEISTMGAGGYVSAYKYQWYINTISSNNSGTIIPGATGSTYTIPGSTIAGSRYYYAIITDTICAASVKTAISEIITNASLAITSQPIDSVAICNNASVVLSVVPQGGSGSYHYQWFQNDVNSNNSGTLITGATSSSYQVLQSSIAGNRYYYVTVQDNISGSCILVSQVSIVHTYRNMSISSQPESDITVCNHTSAILTVNVQGAANNYSYQWYSNNSNSILNGQLINAATNTNYNIPASIIPGARFYYVKVTDLVCGSIVYSNVSVINTLDSLKITSQPALFSFTCYNTGSSISFNGNGGSGNYTYQWYQNIMSTTTGGLVIPGANSMSYMIPATVTQGERYYYAKLIDNTCQVSATTTVATINTLSDFRIISQPLNAQTVCNGANTVISIVKGGGSGAVTYQWYVNNIYSTNGASEITGATADSYIVPGTTTAGDRYYFVKVADSLCGELISNLAIVSTRTNPSFILQPLSFQQICNNSVGNLSAVVIGGSSIFNYQWYSNSVNSYAGATPINGANANILTTNPTTVSGDRYYYLTAFDASCGIAVNSQISTISTRQPINITQQPQNIQIACNGATAILNVELSGGSGQFSYQWFMNSNNSTIGGNPILGAVNAVYAVPSTSLTGSRFYYVQITDATCGNSLTSEVATINTIAALQVQVVSLLQQSVCMGENATINSLVQGGSSSLSYQWYSNSINSITGGTPIPGANSSNLMVNGSITAGTRYFYLVVSDNMCSVQTISAISSVTTLVLPSVNPISSRNYCSGDNIGVIAFEGNYPLAQYSWVNNNSSIGIPASGVGAISNYIVSSANLTSATATIIVTPQSAGCIGSPTTFTITVHPTPVISTILSQHLCAGAISQSINFISSITGTSYQWQNSEPAIGLPTSGIGNIPSFQTLPQQGSSVVVSKISAKGITPAGCASLFTPVTEIRLTPQIIDVSIETAPIAVCPFDTIEPIVAAHPMGGNGVYSYQWQYSLDNIVYTNIPVTSAINRKLIAPQQTATTWYRIIVNSSACQSTSNSVKVGLKTKPTLIINSNGINSVSIGNSYSVLVSGAKTYSWSPASFVINPTASNPILKPETDTRFIVKGYNDEGCSDTASIFIKVLYSSLIYPNNLLTPNGDGFNDKWVVKNLQYYPENQIKIFNANGLLVKEFENYANDWDGRVNGTKLPTSVYYYVITLKRDNTIIKGFLNIAN